MAKTDNKQKGEKVDRLGAKIKSAKEHVANKKPQDAKVDTTKSSWDHANMDLRRMKRKIQKDQENNPDEKKSKKFHKNLKNERRAQKEGKHHEVKGDLKQIWEALRVSGGNQAEKQKQAEEMIEKIKSAAKNDENMAEDLEKYARNHETSRILQTILSKGATDLKIKLCEQLLPKFCECAGVKYANFVCLKMIDCIGIKKERGEFHVKLMAELSKYISGKGSKLSQMMKNPYAGPVIEQFFANHCNELQKNLLTAHFFGKDFMLGCERHIGGNTEEYNLTNLLSKIDVGENGENAVIELLKSCGDLFEKFLDRESLQQHSLIHTALLKYLEVLVVYKDKYEKVVILMKEFVETMREVLPFFCHTKAGSEAANVVIWLGSAKDRKVILKAFAKDDKVVEMARGKYASVVLLCLLDSVDDTKNLSNSIVLPLVPIFEDCAFQKISDDSHARKVFLYILGGREALHKNNMLVQVTKGDEYSTSKKNRSVRQREIFSAFLDKLSKSGVVTEKNIETWWKNNRAALFLADAAKYMITSKMSEKHTAFLETLLNGFADGIEEQGPSFAMRWIFKSAKECADEEGVVTGCAEVNAWIDGYMMEYVGRWLSNNRGCFALLQALEASGSQPLMKSIKKTAKKNPGSCAKSTKGYEALFAKINEDMEE